MNSITDINFTTMENDPNRMVALLEEFTRVYQQYSDGSIALREANCGKIQWKGMVRPIEEDDLFAGRLEQNPIGFVGQSDEGALGYYHHPDAINKLMEDPRLTDENQRILQSLSGFWQKENTVAKTKAAYPEGMREALPSDDYVGETGIAFTLWRMSGIQMDYRKLVSLGIPGLRQEINGHKKNCKETGSLDFYDAALLALDTFCDVCLFYAQAAREQSKKTPREERADELIAMAETLEIITRERPTTLRQALQLTFLYSALDGTRNYGRMDDYLGDLYVTEKEAGTIDEEEAVRLLTSIWNLMISRGYRYDTRLIVGGKGRIHEKNANEVALVILEVTSRVRDIVPQVALRFYKGQDPRLYNKGLDILGSGYTYPMLYNDDSVIPAAGKAFDVPLEEAAHVIQYGCGEYVINHRSVATPSSVLNLLQALIVTMNKGTDPMTDRHMGMPRERYDRYGNFETFDLLFQAYKEQVEYHVEWLARHEELEYIYAGKDNAYLLSSILMDDCLERGKGMFSGGIRYLDGTMESYGNANTADSLVAIRELVYEKKAFTLDQLNQMLKANFAGYEREQRMMANCPKYGNDEEIPDAMMMEVHNHVCNFTRAQNQKTSLHAYLVVIINNDANTVMGSNTPASPDGRYSGYYMNPGNNPMGGADKKGVTAFLNSLLKPDTTIHGGAVQNMKFSKEMFTKNRPVLESLLNTYFEKGGAQAMLTVLGRSDLEEAMKYPEKYQNLIVRVGGFSERFVNLPRTTQQEVLSRTLY